MIATSASKRHKGRARLSVAFILAHRFTLSAFAGVVDVLRLAADEGDRSRPRDCRWQVLSPTMEPIRASCGVPVYPDARPEDPRAFDYVVVVGGLLHELERLDRRHVAFLRAASAAGVPLVGVCTGAFALHAAGLMNGYRCCVSWFHRVDFLERFEGLEPVADQIFVEDRDRLTCAGGASAMHLAAHLVARHVGRATAEKALAILIVDETFPPDQPQPARTGPPPTSDPLVRRALNVLADHADERLSVDDLAARLGVGRRQLERRFAATLGEGPMAAARRQKLADVKHKLATTDKSVAAIAAATGYSDAAHLTRTFRAAEGETPLAFRRRAGGRGKPAVAQPSSPDDQGDGTAFASLSGRENAN